LKRSLSFAINNKNRYRSFFFFESTPCIHFNEKGAMRQIRKAKAVRSAPTSIRKDGLKVAFHLLDGLAYDLEGLAAAARQITYKTDRMGNPPLDFLTGIVKRTSAKNATSCGNTDVTYIL